jgi:hypothetical protein
MADINRLGDLPEDGADHPITQLEAEEGTGQKLSFGG